MTRIRTVLKYRQAFEAHLGIPQQLGRYHVRRKIGEGGMGVVYEGYDPFIARRVALKAIRREFVEGPDAEEFLRRLQREAQAAGSLNHPNVVAIYDYCEDLALGADGEQLHAPFIVMEYIEGRELGSCFKSQEHFALIEIQRVMGQILDALRYLHSHDVVHRDIKPANIILLDDGSAKVADFGIARSNSSTLTRVGSMMGSPNYMSPEQFAGQAVDGRCDLYAAGVILFQFLTGELPFSGTPPEIMHKALYELPPAPSAVALGASKAFDAIVRRALAKRPGERFQTATEFKQAIMNVSTGNTGVTRNVAAATPRRVSPARMIPPTRIVAVLAVGVLAIVVGSGLAHRHSSRGESSAAATAQPPQIQSASMLLPGITSRPPDAESTAATVVTPATASTPASEPRTKVAARPPRKAEEPDVECSILLQKASLEPLSSKETTALAKGCR